MIKLRSIIVALLGLAAMAAPASAGCVYLEGGVGGTMSKDHLSVPGTGIDLNQTGVLASLGVFCRVVGPVGTKTGMFFDLGGRGSIEHNTGDLGPLTLKSTYMAEVLARLGYRYHEKIEVYGQGGVAWNDLKLPSPVGTKEPFNYELGAGIRTHVSGGWWIGLEGDYLMADKQDVMGSAKLQQDALVARANLTLFFGESGLTTTSYRPLK